MHVKHGWFLAIALFLSGCASPDVPTVYRKDMQFEAKPKMVLIVSFDGLRPDAIAPADAGHLISLAETGISAKSAHTIVPSLTLPSHSSMLSGVSPEKHGIYWNNWDPSKGLIRVTTIFDEAKKAGLRTAMVVGKEKFMHLNHPGSVDSYSFNEGSPDEIAKITEKVIQSSQPQLLFVHFAHPDLVGHDEGWMSPEQFDAIHEADQGFGRILKSLQDLNLLSSTAIIVTSDHGGSGKGHGDASEVSTSIPWLAAGAGITKGVLDKPIKTYDTAATAAALLRIPIPTSWDGKSALKSEL